MEFDDLNQSLGVFESALGSSKVEIAAVGFKRILFSLDGSNQDETGLELVRALAGPGREIFVVHGAHGVPGPDEHARVARALETLGAGPKPVRAQRAELSGAHPGRQLLSAAFAVQADLLVVPAPYLRDITTLRDESLSSPIDLMLAETRVPVLLVREPLGREVSTCLERIVLPSTTHVEEVTRAASWAFALLASDGTVELHAVADEAELRQHLGLVRGPEPPIEAGELLRAEERHMGALIGALQKRGAEVGARVVADVEVGRAHRRLIELIHERPCLVVVGLPRERQDDGFHFAVDLALASRYPVLLVPPAERAD